MIARGTLNLFSAQALIALQVLIAMRAGKLEITHAGSLAEFVDSTMRDNGGAGGGNRLSDFHATVHNSDDGTSERY
jgi:hypothetical protein